MSFLHKTVPMHITLIRLLILYGTMNIYKEIPRFAREMAEQYCEGRWIAVGGGGYDIWRVVPRAWAHIWLAMKDIPAPTGPLPEEWINEWQQEAPVPLIPTWEDPKPLYEPIPRKTEITEKNAQMLNKALHIIRTEKIMDVIIRNFPHKRTGLPKNRS